MAYLSQMNPKLRILIPVVKGLAKTLGKDYEVNLHDVSMLEHSLVLCENGYVTGRSEGSPMTDFGLFMLQSEKYRDKDGIFNYLAKNNRGELIRCTCIFIRDEEGQIIAFLCINYDLKKAMAARDLIESLVRIDIGDAEQYQERADSAASGGAFPEPVNESFAQNLEEVIVDSVEAVKKRIGKPLNYLTKTEKEQIIGELSAKGFFRLKGSVEALAAEMGITKFTVYAYIREIQKQNVRQNDTE